MPSSAPGTVALRLSVPVEEAPIEAGAAQALAALARARLPGLVGPLGIDADVSRTPWGIAYAVTGPSTDVDYLAWVLRELVGPPTLTRTNEARALLRREWTRRRETGRGRVELRLRTTTSIGQPPLLGSGPTIDALTPAGLQELWIRTHRPERMTLIVAGEVAPEILLASFDRLGSREMPAAAPAEVPVPADARAEPLDLLRTAAGVAWSAPEPLSPELAVAAVFLAEEIRASDPGFEARVALWESAGRSTLALIGAAYRRDLGDLRRWLASGLERVADRIGPADVERVVRRLRTDILSGARTPVGQVRLVGRFVDAGVGEAGVVAYLDRLERLTAAELATALRRISDADPVTVEIDR